MVLFHQHQLNQKLSLDTPTKNIQQFIRFAFFDCIGFFVSTLYPDFLARIKANRCRQWRQPGRSTNQRSIRHIWLGYSATA